METDSRRQRQKEDNMDFSDRCFGFWFNLHLTAVIVGYRGLVSGCPKSVTSKDVVAENSWYTTETFQELETATGSVMSTEVTSSTMLYNNTVVMVIVCLVILVAIVVLAVFVYQRTKCARMLHFHPFTKTDGGNRQNETVISANELLETSLQENNDHLSVYSLAEEADFAKTGDDPTVYSAAGQTKLSWKEGESAQKPTTNKTKAEDHTIGPDVYAAVDKPSKTLATYSAFKIDQVQFKGLVKKSDCFPDQIYSLASDNMTDIYANEMVADSTTQSVVEGVSKTPSPQDDGGQTVIENDLYSH